MRYTIIKDFNQSKFNRFSWKKCIMTIILNNENIFFRVYLTN